ncbi:MAG: acylphosphatase [Armatimonadetes bacterium]|nr:acylphosphatase [Armatimonadota bacterium]
MSAPPTPRVRVRLRLRGLVQGVGFRFFVQRRGRALGLAGFVRNLSDGGVEIAAEGPPADVQALIDSVRQGPPGAAVSEVTMVWEDPHMDAEFMIRADGHA